MNSDVLALKYRPKFFDEVVGQDFVVQTLSNSITLDKIHNAYLFSGTRGVGKTTIGRILAKSLLCENGISVKACGTCSSCTEIDNGNHLDLIEIDAASRTKVEDTRILMENVQYVPSSSRFKVYLIDEVHMLSNKSFNALLKTIEEPPAHVKFLLATTEPEKLPETVLSRCLHFKLSTVDNETLSLHIKNILKKEHIECENKSVDLISVTAKGSIRDGLSLLEQCIAYCNGKLDEQKIKSLLGEIDSEIVKDLVASTLNKDSNKLIETIEKIDMNANFEKIIDLVITIFYKITLFKIKPGFISKDNTDYKFVEDQEKVIDARDLQLFYQIAITSKQDFKFSVNKRDHLAMILLRMIFFADDSQYNKKNSNEKILPDTQKQKVITVDVKENKVKGKIKKSNLEKTNGEKLGSSNEPSKNDISQFLWEEILPKLDISGLSLNLAKNSILTDIENGKAILKVDKNKQDVYPKPCITDLINKINQHFDKELSIKIEYEQDLMSPEMKENKQKQDEANKAFEVAQNDVNIDNIKKYFGAEIDKDSIKKVNDN